MKVKQVFTTLFILSAFVALGQSKKHKGEKQPARIVKTKDEALEIEHNFCNTLVQIAALTPYNFEMVRGKEIEATTSGTLYATLRGVVGTQASVIVNDSGWRYEGILYQDTSKEWLDIAYKENVVHLRNCLGHMGYILREEPNADPVLEKYPTLTYKYATGDTRKIGMKAERSDINGITTITLFIIK